MVNQQFATAIHIMSALGFNEGKLMTSEVLAGSLRANSVLIRTLIQKLNQAGLVETVRGKTGGVRIVRAPKSIYLSEIYRSLEPQPLICKRKTSGNRNCPVGRCMDKVVQQISDQIEKKVMTFLSEQTLSEVLAKVR
jgi:Rrf2 family protein